VGFMVVKVELRLFFSEKLVYSHVQNGSNDSVER
jgi:hypothetical protein